MSAAQLVDLEPILIGTVEIRPGTREVLGPVGREVIEPKVMQVLMLLVAAGGEIVTRDRLVQECWNGRAVSEDAISRVVQRLRRLSESLGTGGFVIKTIHKVGYRLLPSDGAIQGVLATPQPQALPKMGALTRRAAIGMAALLAAGAGGLSLLRRGGDGRRTQGLIVQSEQALKSGMPEGEARAVNFLKSAVRAQPDNAVAWGKLALAQTYAAEAAPPDRKADAVAAVQESARRAQGIDPQQVDALSALALLPPYYGAWLAAERRMDAVLARDPHHLPTRDARDFMLSAVGRGREGSRDRIRMAAEDPLHAVYQTMLIYAHWTLGNVDDADRAADRALQLWPKSPAVWLARFYTLALTGRAERALALVMDVGSRPDLSAGLVKTLRTAGVGLATRRPADIAEARMFLIGGVSNDPSGSIMALTLLSGLGEIDAAFQVADAYLLERGSLMARVRWQRGQNAAGDERRRKTNMLFLPSSAPMRADPRFATLVARIGLADYWARAGVRPDYLT